MSENDKKVIGYIACYSRTKVLFVGDACLVMGSENQFQNYISKNVPEHKTKLSLKKIRFGDITRFIEHGEKIVFDEESFRRFYPLGKNLGFELDESSLNSKESIDLKFYLVGGDELITTHL